MYCWSLPVMRLCLASCRFNNNDSVFAFLLSTRAGGQGLNLTGADTVCGACILALLFCAVMPGPVFGDLNDIDD